MICSKKKNYSSPIESRVSLPPQKFAGCYDSSNLGLRSFVASDLYEVS